MKIKMFNSQSIGGSKAILEKNSWRDSMTYKEDESPFCVKKAIYNELDNSNHGNF